MNSNRRDQADDFRPMKYYPPERNQERDDAYLDSGRKSSGSFAEAVESEIEENFKAKVKNP